MVLFFMLKPRNKLDNLISRVEISSLKQTCCWQITLLTFYIPDDANFIKKQYGAVNVLLWKQRVVEGKVYILKKFFQIKQAILYQDIQSSMYMLRFLKRQLISITCVYDLNPRISHCVG